MISEDVNGEIEAEKYEIEVGKEVMIIAKITNNEDKELNVDVFIMVGNEEFYNEKSISIMSGETKKIYKNWSKDVVGFYKFEVIVKIGEEEVARDLIGIEVVENENGGICVIGYVIPSIFIFCIRKFGR